MVKTILSTARGNAGSGSVAAGATGYFWPGTSTMVTTNVLANREIPWRTPGVISKLYFRLVLNNTTADSTLKLRKNGADSGMGVSIPAGTIGAFEDNVNTVAVSPGDRLTYQIVNGGGGSISCSLISVIFDASTNCVNRLVSQGYAVTTATANHFIPISGNRSGTTSLEANTQNIIKTSGTIKNAFIYVSANARTTNTVFTLRKNGVNTAMTFTYGNLETGNKEDTTNSISVAPDDKLAWVISSSTGTESLTFQHIAVDFESTTNEGWISAGSVGATADTVVLEPVSTNYAIGGGMFPSTSELQHQMKARETFTFRNLIVYVAINTIDANCTFSLRKNGVNAMSVTIGPNSTGYLSNTTDSVTVSENDLINYRIVTPDVVGTQSMTIRQMSITTELPVIVPPIVEPPVFGAGGRVRRVYLGKRIIEEPERKPKTIITRIKAGKSQPLLISSARRLMLLDEEPGVTLEITGIISKPKRRIKITRTKLPASSQRPVTLEFQRLVIVPSTSPVTVAFNSLAVLNASQIGLRMFDINKYDQRTERLQRLYKLLKITSYFESGQN